MAILSIKLSLPNSLNLRKIFRTAGLTGYPFWYRSGCSLLFKQFRWWLIIWSSWFSSIAVVRFNRSAMGNALASLAGQFSKGFPIGQSIRSPWTQILLCSSVSSIISVISLMDNDKLTTSREPQDYQAPSGALGSRFQGIIWINVVCPLLFCFRIWPLFS